MIKNSKTLINEAVKQLSKYQHNEEVPIVTSYDHFNEMSMGGIYKGTITTLAARSGIGKSYFAQQLEADVFDGHLNPGNEKYVLLRCNWEMSVLKLLTRRIAKYTGSSYKKVLTTPPNDNEVEQFKQVCGKERDERIFYMDLPVTPEIFEAELTEFATIHSDKDHILVSIDHIGLVKDDGRGKKKAIDDLIEAINRLRNKFSNLSFLILIQMNREIESRTELKDLAPLLSDLMNSDTVAQISDMVIALNVPYRLGFDKYMIISGIKKDGLGNTIPSRYSHLRKYMIHPENKTTNFCTTLQEGKIPLLFVHYLKLRDGLDLSTYKDLFIQEML